MIWGEADVIIIHTNCKINVMCLNLLETIAPTLVQGKAVYHETGPWCQKGWRPFHRPPASETFGEGVTVQAPDLSQISRIWPLGGSPGIYIWRNATEESGKVRNTALGQHFPIWGSTKLPRNLVNYTDSGIQILSTGLSWAHEYLC